MIYKFRAECIGDVKELLNKLPLEKMLKYNVIPDDLGLPDVEIEIEILNYELDDYLNALRKIEDSHVMLQTILPIEKYTGERNYELV